MSPDEIAQTDQEIAEISEALAILLFTIDGALGKGVDVTEVASTTRRTALANLDPEDMASVLAVALVRLAQARRG